MFIFVMQIFLTLSLGGIAFLVAHKIPVLVTLPEQPLVPREAKKALREKVKDLTLAKRKELFNMEALKKERLKEDKATRQEEFEDEPNYWRKVKGK